MERDWTMDDVVMLYEIRGVYDGWSAAQLKDGRIVNRWDEREHPGRHAKTAAWIRAYQEASS